MPFTLVFSQKHRCLLSCRTGVVFFQRWTEPWTHDLGTPWVGPPGPVGRAGGTGALGPFRPIRGPFRPVFLVSRRFLHELGLDRAGHSHGHLGPRSEARLRGLRARFGPFVDRLRPFCPVSSVTLAWTDLVIIFRTLLGRFCVSCAVFTARLGSRRPCRLYRGRTHVSQRGRQGALMVLPRKRILGGHHVVVT
jgi:hypothetical protein